MSRVSGVTELVRVMILRGDFGFGGRLVEFRIAERLGVRRPTVREALRRLEGEGLLVTDESGGMRVVAIGELELAATLELRAPLEELSAGLAAAHLGRSSRLTAGAGEHPDILAAVAGGDQAAAAALARDHALAAVA